MKRTRTSLKAVIFDLDGTLIDSVRDVAWVAGQALSSVGLTTPPEERIRAMIGDGLASLVQRAFHESLGFAWDAPIADTARYEQALATARAAYDREPCREAVVFEGVFEALAALSGRVRLGVVTNKPSRVAVEVLQQLSLEKFFEHVLGADSLSEKKPHPMPLMCLQRRWDLSADEVVMVGDHKNDYLAGTAAGMQTALVAYGYSDVAALRSLRPEFLIERPTDLLLLCPN